MGEHILLVFWERLRQVTLLSFNGKSSIEAQNWTRKGNGEVLIGNENNNVLIYHEKGTWLNIHGDQVRFTNVLRWTLDLQAGVILLEHLRRGVDQPVSLVHFVSTDVHLLSCVDLHFCGSDTYSGQIHWEPSRLHLNWKITGPKKNEEIDCYYS